MDVLGKRKRTTTSNEQLAGSSSTPKAKSQRVSTPGEADEDSPLLALPAELRIKIYELALHAGGPITTGRRSYRGSDGLRRLPVAPPNYLRDFADRDDRKNHLPVQLLRVNRQISREATEYLYKNEIVVNYAGTLLALLAAVGIANRGCLQRVTVCYWSYSHFSQIRNLAIISLLGDARKLSCLRLAIGSSNQAIDDVLTVGSLSLVDDAASTQGSWTTFASSGA